MISLLPEETAGVSPLVTVITVTYNSSSYVRDAIESVLAQTYTNIEYIIADDCSTDDTWSIIQEYKDPRISAYRNESNLGEYPNRNKAIDLAKGVYLIFIDGDDMIYEHGISVYVKYASDFPEAKLIIQKTEINKAVYPLFMQPRDILLNYFNGINLITSSLGSNFFKAELLQNTYLPVTLISGDEYIRLKIACSNNILIIPGSMTWIRETPGQASEKLNSLKGQEDTYKVFRMLELDFKQMDTEAYQFIIKRLIISRKKELIHALKRVKINSVILIIKEVFFYLRKVKTVRKTEVVFTDISKFSPATPFKNKLLVKKNSRPI